MSELDVRKERISYNKLWLGVSVAGNVGVLTWMFQNYQSSSLPHFLIALGASVGLSAGTFFLHRKIERQIEALKDL